MSPQARKGRFLTFGTGTIGEASASKSRKEGKPRKRMEYYKVDSWEEERYYRR